MVVSAARRLLVLLTGAAVFWVVAAPLVRYLADDEWTPLFSGTALLMCLLPAAVTLLWADRALSRQEPEQQLLVVLGGTGVRLFGVLIVALVLYFRVPPFQGAWSFLVWLVACYLFVLALEIILVLRGRSDSSSSSSASAAGGPLAGQQSRANDPPRLGG